MDEQSKKIESRSYNDPSVLSDDELEITMNSLTKKMLIADSLGKEEVIKQLQLLLDALREEHKTRVEIVQYNSINDQIPDSYIIGEDNDPREPIIADNDLDNAEHYTRRYRRRSN